MQKGPAIMLGVGATKAGTSWLHSYLSGHPECHFRSIKELHFFDSLENGRLERALESHRREAGAIRDRLQRGRAGVGASTRLRDREDWIGVLERGEDIGAYIDYLTRDAGAARIAGEVTPAYALLPEKRLMRMARMVPDVRFVYVMRDPVARLWSHVRMIAGRRDAAGRVEAGRAGRILRRVFRGEEPQIALRGDYRGALEKLSRAVDPSRLLVLIFEDLVAGGAIERLCEFLGIAPRRAERAPVHVGQPVAMTMGQRRDARDWLAPQYDFVAEWLGARPTGWAYDLAEAK